MIIMLCPTEDYPIVNTNDKLFFTFRLTNIRPDCTTLTEGQVISEELMRYHEKTKMSSFNSEFD